MASVVMLGVHLKVRLSAQGPNYDAKDEIGYFREESALQFRYARMVARGEAIPEVDREAQFPEGIRTGRELTLLMERAAGWSYRLLPRAARPESFFWFALLWVGLVASLSTPALYALAFRQSRSRVLALAVAAVYGVSWVSACNGIRSFVHESFAFPLIAASFTCLVCALDRQEKRARLYALSSGLALSAALASWHFTRFYVAGLLAAGIWAYWRHRKDADSVRRLRFGFLVVGAVTVAVLALNPVDASAYGHVYALWFEKLRQLLSKPSDPLLLSQEARLLWLGAFNSPKASFAFFALFPMILIAVPRGWAVFKKEEAPASAAGSLTDAMLVVFALGAAMVSRLLPMFAFFFCAAAARLPERLARKNLVLIGFALLACAEAFKSIAPFSPYNPFMALSAVFAKVENEPMTSVRAERGAVEWIRRNGERRPVLANFGLSPTFLVYADSPVLLQTKFESSTIRAKTVEFLEALYSDEEAFYRFCEKYGAGLFVYTPDDVLDLTGDGPRYIAGVQRLTPATAAVRFQFHPDSLRRFRLVYQNEGYRIYAVGEAPRVKADPAANLIYDIREYHPETLADGALRLDIAGALARMRQHRDKLRLARLLARLDRREAALSAYEAALAAWPEREAKAEIELVRRAWGLRPAGAR